ncbi:MAG: beta-1,6-N-acetylglucosaminyltransferase [Alteraurantiacibacter sp.]
MAYLIMAHADRGGVQALLHALLPPGTPDLAIVHIDGGSDLWREVRGGGLSDDPRVILLPDPAKVIWGHRSLVTVHRLLLEAALAERVDYAHALSGVCWPVASRECIVAEIAAAPPGACFAEAIVGAQAERMQDYRLDTRWLRLDPARDRLAYAATWELRRLARWGGHLRHALKMPRSMPLGPWHKGSGWWSLPASALASTARDLTMLEDSGRLKGTVCADEHAVPTSLALRHGEHLQPNRRFIAFPSGQSSPRVLTKADLPAIRASGAWFMRKVDAEVDRFFRVLP